MSGDAAGPSRRGSHAPSLRVLVRRAMLVHALARSGERVLVACSGGPDSTALLHALALLREELGITLVAHGIDHGLRTDASTELAQVGDLATGLAVPFSVTRVQVSEGSNLQARARAARHHALAEAATAAGAMHIATGHTANDRAETLLMRMVRGTGVRGLAVLPPRNGALIRPLYRAHRSDVLKHLERHDLPSSMDPSNESKRFLRSRIRHELLPLLEVLSPKVVDAVCALADAASEIDSDPLAALSRAHRMELTKALQSGAETSIWLPDGVEILVRRRSVANGSAPLSPARRRDPKRSLERGDHPVETLRTAAKDRG